jgi:hypothetical protein
MLPDNLTYQQVKDACKVIRNPEYRTFMEEAVALAFDERNFGPLKHALGLHSYPVHIEEFLFSVQYASVRRGTLYPAVVDELIEINEKRGRLLNTVTEFVGTGGIGSAKTTTALYTQQYQLYLLSCYKSVHRTFGMDPSSEVAIVFQSLSATSALDVDYKRFRSMCENSAYFTTKFPFRKDYLSAMIFPNRIEVKPIGSDAGAIGQNVISGVLDEVNFMVVVEDSKKIRGGGKYDQAAFIYDGISRRIQTRFVEQGAGPGVLCLVSSRNYPGEFTDRKIEEAKTNPSIYIYDKCVWDVKPPGTFCGERFPVFVGDLGRKPRILSSVDEVSEEDRGLVKMVPIEYRKPFESDISGSIRDLAGVGTISVHPYMLNVEAVTRCFGTHRSILNREETDFSEEQDLMFYSDRFRMPGAPRAVHIDLSITNDAAGVSCVYVPGFAKVQGEGEENVMPLVQYDFMLRVLPPKGDEIKFFKIRDLILKLRAAGLNIKWVTFDGFQSVDSVQVLRTKGFITGYISTDMSMVPYAQLKAGFYDGRIRAPKHDVALRECLQLKYLPSKKKFDHPDNGSKDVSDSMAGAYKCLISRREIWTTHGIAAVQIPDSIRTMQQTEDQSAGRLRSR